MSAATPLPDVVIIASGGANTASLQFALERLGARVAWYPPTPAKFARPATSFSPESAPRRTPCRGFGGRDWTRLIPALQQPVLGICLGMQLLYEASRRRPADCLGIIPGRAARFAPRRRPAGAAHGLEHAGRSNGRAPCSRAYAPGITPTSCTAMH